VGEFLANGDPEFTTKVFRDNYEELGDDSPPPGNTFNMPERARMEEAYLSIKALPLHKGPLDASITLDEIIGCIHHL